jgi:hypothetical protein
MFKICGDCKQNKSFEEFYNDRRRNDGKFKICKLCVKNKPYNSKESIKQTAKKSYQKRIKENPDFYKKYREKNIEKVKEWDRKKYLNQMATNPEKRRHDSKMWYRKQKQLDPDFNKKLYQRQREKVLSYQKKNYPKNRIKVNARMLVRGHVKKGWLYRPKNCTHCHIEVKRIEAHHEDYAKPLEVIWLCNACHIIADKRKKEREGDSSSRNIDNVLQGI